MLVCLFQLADLDLQKPVRIDERRGDVAVEIARIFYTDYAIQGLNEATAEFLTSGRWFQLWKGEIISKDSPPTPQCPTSQAPVLGYPAHITGDPGLAVRYVMDDGLPKGTPVRLKHERGRLTYRVSPRCLTPVGLEIGAIRFIEAAGQTMLRGGQWIQVWDGEIITMYDGGPSAEGESDGRIRRGQVVQEGSR
jgi:hypothetical protein